MRIFAAFLLFGALAVAPKAGFAHGSTMLLAADADRSGQLIIAPGFEFEEVYPLEAGVSIGGFTLYTATIPSFAWLIAPEPSEAPVAYPLKANTQVRFELISISANTAVRISGTRMTMPGQTAVIGDVSTDPSVHVHPEWQVTLPEGVVGEFQVAFRLTTTTRSYTTSAVYQVTLTNRSPAPTPTLAPTATATMQVAATPTPTSSLDPTASATPAATATSAPATPTSAPATPSASARDSPSPTATSSPTVVPVCEGDCSADGLVTVDDVVKLIQIALGNLDLSLCEPGDSNHDQQVTVEEIVRAVNNALAGCPASA